jgi:uncharacterized protein (TIGR03083 family)
MNTTLKVQTPPINTVHLFPILDNKLISLLRSLSSREWQLPTRAKLWTVKDIAAHLLDGNIRTLSMSRDKYYGESSSGIHNYHDLVSFLNRLNADWVKAYKRVSPSALIDMLAVTGKQYQEHLASLDPFDKAIFSVGWAGEQESKNWFHVAREYTEKWHHQQQIREVVHQPGIQSRELYHPVLETFLLALPYHYSKFEAPEGKRVQVIITGAAGGQWEINRASNRWDLTAPGETPDTTITIDQDNAWKLLTKGLSLEEAHRLVQIKGDQPAGLHFLSMLSVMA